jgi:hypothetical protein
MKSAGPFRSSRQKITHAVVDSIVREQRYTGLPGTIWPASGDESDEIIIADFLAEHEADIEVRFEIARWPLLDDYVGGNATCRVLTEAPGAFPGRAGTDAKVSRK